MPDNTPAPGTLSKLALVKGATWGTLATLTTNHRYPFKSSTLDQRVGRLPNEVLAGVAERQVPFLGNKHIEGNVVFDCDYRQHGLLAAFLMGEDGNPSTVETGVYKHTMLWTPSVYGKFLSAGVDRGGSVVREFHSVKPVGRVTTSRAGGYVEETYDFLGRGLTKGGSSSGWTFANSPLNGGAKYMRHAHLVVRVNAQGGSALASPTDVLTPVELTVEVRRNLGTEFSQGNENEEPIPDGFAEITVKLRFLALTSNLCALFRDAYDADTFLKMDAVWTDTSALLGATKYRERAMFFSKLAVVECPEVIPGPGKVPFEVTMSAHAATSDPSGFPTGGAVAMVETWQNEVSADYLA